jgi:hypothetical protein
MADLNPPKAQEPSQKPSLEAFDAKGRNDAVPAVRFSSAVETISPDAQQPSAERPGPSPLQNEPGPTGTDNLKTSSMSLHGTGLQERRMNTFQFEAFSLPPSRVSHLPRNSKLA